MWLCNIKTCTYSTLTVLMVVALLQEKLKAYCTYMLKSNMMCVTIIADKHSIQINTYIAMIMIYAVKSGTITLMCYLDILQVRVNFLDTCKMLLKVWQWHNYI